MLASGTESLFLKKKTKREKKKEKKEINIYKESYKAWLGGGHC